VTGQSVSWLGFLAGVNWPVLALLLVAPVCLWLIGLIIVLHGTKPSERPAILRAYALCRPWGYVALVRTTNQDKPLNSEAGSRRRQQALLQRSASPADHQR
jgi:hypothetical protein